jgi:nucleoside-diphosphate-sugar epimerase
LAELAPDLTTQINHVAAVRLAATARKVGVKRFVLSSTCSVYGFQGDEFITEQSPLNPLTLYAVSKCRAERDIRRLANPSFHVVCLRNGTAYGPSPMIRFDLVVNNLVAWGYTTGKVLLKSDGSAWRPLVHVEDICLAFIAALEAPTVAVTGEVFNIGRTQDNIRIRDLATMIAKFMPDCRVEYAAGAVPDKRSYRVNCSKANAALPGFRSAWNLETGVRQIVDAIRSSNIKGRQFEEFQYGRIMHLKHRLAVGSVDRQLRVSC